MFTFGSRPCSLYIKFYSIKDIINDMGNITAATMPSLWTFMFDMMLNCSSIPWGDPLIVVGVLSDHPHHHHVDPLLQCGLAHADHRVSGGVRLGRGVGGRGWRHWHGAHHHHHHHHHDTNLTWSSWETRPPSHWNDDCFVAAEQAVECWWKGACWSLQL